MHRIEQSIKNADITMLKLKEATADINLAPVAIKNLGPEASASLDENRTNMRI